MTKKRLFIFGVHFLLIVLVLASVANAEFYRLTGDTGWGEGYGYGYGEGYGFDGGSVLGFRYADPGDETFDYGYGYGYLSSSATYDPGLGAHTFSSLDISDLNEGNFAVFGLDGEAPETGSLSNAGYIVFASNVILPIASGVTVYLPQFLMLSAGENVDFSSFGGNSISASDLSSASIDSILSAFQFGLPDHSVDVSLFGSGSTFITISVNVGSSYDGQTLSIYHKSAGGSWSPLTICIVGAITSGTCSFNTSSLSSFAVATPASGTTPTVTSSGGRSGGVVRPYNPFVSSSNANKFVVKNNCYKLEKGKIQLMAKSNCYLRIYNKKTKKYTEILKFGVESASQLVRVGKSSSIYSIQGKCKKQLVVSNWKTLVTAKRVTSITAQKLASYPACSTK